MKKILLPPALLLLPVLLCAAPLTPVQGRVVKAPLNVRAGAGMNYTIVGKLAENNPVSIVAANREWLEIRAPENTATWVLEKYIKNNQFTVGVNLRSGPGVSYEVLGSARPGMTVTVAGQPTPSGWVMIQPYYWTRVYVGRKAVEADEAELAKLPGISDKIKPPPKPELAKIEGNFNEPAQDVRRTGRLYPAEGKKSAITHVFYLEKGNDLVPEAFVAPYGLDLTKFDEKKVVISGMQSSIKGWELPVIIVQGVQPVK